MTAALEIDSGALAAPTPNAAGVRAYLGIPFAAPPVGDQRWRAPQPAAPWAGVRATNAYGPSSLQGVIWDDIHLGASGVSEDCLYLNVWTPAAPGSNEKFAVMLWIHGGGFAVGSGSEPRYEGARLASQGIVVVTVNHRLNALGFLAHPELTAEAGASGNFGMLDLVAALKWVQSNIAAFGGDPTRVTIAGESAGSMAVSGLMASPLARGLFARCIGESGALFPGLMEPLKSRAAAERDGLAFMAKLGAKSLAEMRALPAEAILTAAPGLGFRPCVDGLFLPRPLEAIFGAGEQNDVALMAGWNKDEGFNFTVAPDGEAATFDSALAAYFGAHSRAAAEHYPSGASAEASAAELGADNVIVHKTWAWLEAQKRTGSAQVYRFQFDRAPLTPQGWFGKRDSAKAGAFHAGEINYVFDTLDVFPWLVDDADRQLSKTTVGYWVHFVKTGDPNGEGLPFWPSYREASAKVMHLDATSAAAPQSDRARHLFLAEFLGGLSPAP